MPKTYRIALIGALAAGCLLAQDPSPQSQPQFEDRLNQRMQQLKDQLQVTPEQTDQIRPLFVDEIRQFKALLDKYGDPRSASLLTKRKMRLESRSIQERTDDQLKTIFSKQQMKDFERLREQWRQERREELMSSARR
ncbi:MAG TPA: hypothetical protein VN754_09525 [Candidatus Binataceae bacterium]|nr:hypothetical protein [Candidatus Binataceae bacterium]